MSIATDNVSHSQKPDRWQIRTLMGVALILAVPLLLISFAFLAVANNVLFLPLGQMQTLMFVMLVFTSQINVYLIRERHHFWNSLPSRWMIFGTILNMILVSILATQGILMDSIPFHWILLSFAVIALYLPLADRLKLAVFKSSHLI